jgi:hypothetical protein
VLVPDLARSLTLKTEEKYPSETRVEFQWAIWRHIPEDKTVGLYFKLFRLNNNNNNNNNNITPVQVFYMHHNL